MTNTLAAPARRHTAGSILARRGDHPCLLHAECNVPGYVYRWAYENLPPYCYLCLTPLTKPNQQVDHIIPFATVGTECMDNVARCCATCNQIKGSQSLEDLATGRDQ